MEPTFPDFHLLPVFWTCLRLCGWTEWHRWTWVMKDLSASQTAVGMVASGVVCYGMMDTLTSIARMTIHTFQMDVLLVGVPFCTPDLGCEELPLQFRTLQILGCPVSRIDCPPFPWVCSVLWCHRPVFHTYTLVNVVWLLMSRDILTFEKLRSCFLYWILVFRMLVHSSRCSPVGIWKHDFLAVQLLLTSFAEIVVFIHEGSEATGKSSLTKLVKCRLGFGIVLAFHIYLSLFFMIALDGRHKARQLF